MKTVSYHIASLLNISEAQISAVLNLFNEGATIPFIARYRKERTHGLDDEQIHEIKIENERFAQLIKRKKSVIETIREQGKLSPALEQRINNCFDINELEDLYLPYKPKRKTKATIAKEQGLEPLAKIMMKQSFDDPEILALRFVKGDVEDAEGALRGAQYIISEWVSENERVRKITRKFYWQKAQISAHWKTTDQPDASKYMDYKDFSEGIRKIPSHRFLAIRRGENEGLLKVGFKIDKNELLEKFYSFYCKNDSELAVLVKKAIKDAMSRLIAPSIENEIFKAAKEKADAVAIKVFAKNLYQLLMAAPLGGKRILAIDPGFRTGCKVVCLDELGTTMHNETIFPHPPQKEKSKAKKKLASLVDAYKIEAIAIGNGTAGRETEALVKNTHFPVPLQVFIVSEDGASVYSASKIARQEFPQYDVTVRGAISIGRRLMDPLAELVKIDPKSIGVGQYQHDVDQALLKESLNQTLINAVNKVGVNLNTASVYLLSQIAGLNESLAQNIVAHREQHGPFSSRKELLDVKRLGPASYQQAAGFLRIPNAENPLDNSAVHPESYFLAEQMAKDIKCTLDELISRKELRDKIILENYISNKVGLPTLKDIRAELDKPGRDPRQKAKIFEFDPNIRKIEDLRTGMILPGIVTNITNFGAFVDIGIKQNGLIHVSNMKEEYISDPNTVVRLHQQLMVKVLDIDIERLRIQLTLKGLELD